MMEHERVSSVTGKLRSAMRIAHEAGWSGLLQAVGRNLGVSTLQTGLDESAVAWDFFRSQHQSAATMVDVGAHYGGALRPFARDGWQIFAFEPDASNRERLVAEFSRMAHVHIDPRAVADQPREGVAFFRSEVSSGISGLSAFDASHQQAGLTDVTTLTALVEARGLKEIDFLKIDTEGHDLFVLRGFPWARLRPRLVLCEFEDKKTEPLGYRYEDLVAELHSQGYVVITSEWHPIERYGIQHRWRRFAEGDPPALANPLGWGNVFGVRDAADLPVLRAACARAEARELRRRA